MIHGIDQTQRRITNLLFGVKVDHFTKGTSIQLTKLLLKFYYSQVILFVIVEGQDIRGPGQLAPKTLDKGYVKYPPK